MQALLIHSPGAGIQGASADDLSRLLKTAGYEVEVRTPKDQDCAVMIARGADLIVAAGGDGTVATVLLAAASGARIGVIPLGTANNMANTLGIAGTPTEVIAGWADAALRPIDIWTARGPWGERRFVEGCGLGALTSAAHQMDDKAITGHSPEHEISMARAALAKALSRDDPVRARLVIDGTPIEDERFLLLEMLNFGTVGPRLPIAWSADPSDGAIDIGYVPDERYNDFCEWLSDGASPIGEAPIALRQGRRVEVTWHKARFRIGDDYWPPVGEAEPTGTQQATIAAAQHGPSVLVPKRAS